MMPDKLDSKIKESLRDSETPFDPSGWDRLERNLDANASTPQFKFKMNWKYSLNTVLVIAAGSALIAGAIKLTSYLSQVPEQITKVTQPSVTDPNKNVTVPMIKNTTSEEPQKEMIVQQFFPTQVYNIQYPLYNGMKYTGAPNDQVATENFNSEGEFSEQVKNRPIFTNPLVRGYLLGESPVNSQQPVIIKQGGSQLKLSPEELGRLFSDPSLLNSRRELIFGDQIDSKQGYIYPSKEADSMKKILYYQEHPDLNPELINATKEEENKKESSDTGSKSDAPKPPKKEKKDKKKKDQSADTKNSSDVNDNPSSEKQSGEKAKAEDKKKRSDKPKDGGMKKDPLDPYQQ